MVPWCSAVAPSRCWGHGTESRARWRARHALRCVWGLAHRRRRTGARGPADLLATMRRSFATRSLALAMRTESPWRLRLRAREAIAPPPALDSEMARRWLALALALACGNGDPWRGLLSAVVRLLPLRWAGRGARGWLVGALGSGHAGVPVGSPSTGGAWSGGPAGVPVEGSCMARSHRALQRPLCQVSHTRQRPPGRRERTRHVEGGVTISNPAGNLKAVRPAGQSAASELSWAECARKRRPSASLRPPAVENAPGLSTCGNDSHVATRRVPATSRTAANQTHNHTQPYTTTHNHTQPHTTTHNHTTTQRTPPRRSAPPRLYAVQRRCGPRLHL